MDNKKNISLFIIGVIVVCTGAYFLNKWIVKKDALQKQTDADLNNNEKELKQAFDGAEPQIVETEVIENEKQNEQPKNKSRQLTAHEMRFVAICQNVIEKLSRVSNASDNRKRAAFLVVKNLQTNPNLSQLRTEFYGDGSKSDKDIERKIYSYAIKQTNKY